MKRTITYSLQNGQNKSNQYYKTVSDFADELLVEMSKRLGNIVPDFMQYLNETQREPIRPIEEYSLELLVLGVLWRVYAPGVVEIDRGPYSILSFLTRARKQSRFFKPIIDWLRGILGAIFLLPDEDNHTAALNLQTMSRLLAWLSATGDFPDEVKRLQAWQDYLRTRSQQDVILILNQVLALAEWFEGCSQQVLGIYTPNVDYFLANDHQRHQWHEDRFFTGRQRVEYHVTMVATEILNRSMQHRFLDCDQHVVILPPCMCAPGESCQAERQTFGYACTHCSPHCRVHQITLLGQKHGFEVLIMPDELDVFSSDNNSNHSQDTIIGVVGVSCPLTNPGGHWHNAPDRRAGAGCAA